MSHLPWCKKKNVHPPLYMALDPHQVLKLNDQVVTTADLKLKHAGLEIPLRAFLSPALTGGSPLNKLLFMRKQSLPQHPTSPHSVSRPNAPPPAPRMECVFLNSCPPHSLARFTANFPPIPGGCKGPRGSPLRSAMFRGRSAAGLVSIAAEKPFSEVATATIPQGAPRRGTTRGGAPRTTTRCGVGPTAHLGAGGHAQ